MKPEIKSVDELLSVALEIPDYQRPYKWTDKNITELILDIQKSAEERLKYTNFKYRIGTVILFKIEQFFDFFIKLRKAHLFL